jgi:hypothetical protein
MYIYHNKTEDEYYLFGNKQTLSDATGISRDTLVNKFSRKSTKGSGRWDGDGFVIVKTTVTKGNK